MLDPDTGELKFITAPDYETPGAAGGGNAYAVEITATDSDGNQAVQVLKVEVQDVVDEVPPQFTSLTTASVAENTVDTVYTAQATDALPITYSLEDGGDNDLFVTCATGRRDLGSGRPCRRHAACRYSYGD